MPYPHILLTRPIRQAIMIGFIAIFFVIAPLILLYTAGYRYNVKEQRIEQTGVISIDIEPRDAEVHLNTVRIRKKIPMRLANRAPGPYHLTIARDGYHTWEKDISVESKQTTYIKGITLFVHAAPVPLFSEPFTGIERMFPSWDANYLFLTRTEEQLMLLELIDTKTEKRTLVQRIRTEQAPTIAWSPWYNLALIITSSPKETMLELFDGEEAKSIQRLTIPLTRTPLAFQWQKNPDTAAVFVEKDSSILRMGRNGTTIVGKLSDGTSLWYVDGNVNLWEYKESTNELKRQGKEDAYVLQVPIQRIIDVNNERIIAERAGAIQILPREGKDMPSSELEATHVLPNGATGEWYAWSRTELWSIYADGRTVLLNRTGEKIVSVQPLDAYGELLLATDHTLFAFNPGYYITQTLSALQHIETVGVNQKLRKIYILGDSENRRDVFELIY